MSSSNGLVCFTNCLLPQEDGSLVQKDLWVDERRGVILDAQRSFFERRERPHRVIDLGGNILSPGLLDIQINGAYNFDFSVYEGDDAAYRAGLTMIAEKIVETGVTALLPTIITQEKSLYPKLLQLLRPYSPPNAAHLLGWHAEGPFIQPAKKGAHALPFIRTAPQGFASFEDTYGSDNLADNEDWLMQSNIGDDAGVRVITAAPEVEGCMNGIAESSNRGVIMSIGHSIATSDIATNAVKHGARLVTHLFNAMPILHHRDPSIIGLLGASPHIPPASTSSSLRAFKHRSVVRALSGTSPSSPTTTTHQGIAQKSEAFDEILETPTSPQLRPTQSKSEIHSRGTATPKLSALIERGEGTKEYERPFYGLIVDGVHIHPHSVRIAYMSHPDGCILVTDAQKILDPHLKDGIHEWRDGVRFKKEGVKLYIEGTDTLAGSVVTLDTCVRNFRQFTGCAIGEAIKCATFNPAKCLGIEHKKGTLRPGADADLVVMDASGAVLSTWIKGREVWKAAGTVVNERDDSV